MTAPKSTRAAAGGEQPNPLDHLDATPLEQLRTMTQKVSTQLTAIERELPGTSLLTPDERDHSRGKFHDGESAALEAVLGAAPAYQAMVDRLLGAKDDGANPRVFETELLRDRLARRELYAQLGARFQKLADLCTDTALAYGEHTRPPILGLYHLALALAPHDAALHTQIAPAIEFYGHAAHVAAHTRAQQKHPAGDGSTSKK